MATYTDAIFPLGDIADRYALSSTKFFSRLSGVHRADNNAIRGASRSGQVPPTAVRDLADAKAVTELRAQIEHESTEARGVLGHLARGTETDVPLLERMLEARTTIAKALLERCELGKLDDLLQNGAGLELQLATEALENAHNRYTEAIKTLDTKSDVSATVTVRALLSTLSTCVEKVGDLEKSRSEIEAARRVPPANLVELFEDCVSIQAFEEITRTFADAAPKLERLFPGFDSRSDGNWDEIVESCVWANSFRAAWPEPVPPDLATLLTSAGFVPPERTELARVTAAASTHAGAVTQLFDEESQARWSVLESTDSTAASAAYQQLVDQINDVQAWIDYAVARDTVASTPWVEFLERLEERSSESSAVVPAFDRAFHAAWLEDVFRRDERLGRFRGRDHEILIEEFRQLDRRLITHAREVIIHRCNSRRPHPEALPGSEVAIIVKEASKRRRHKPVRQLLREAAHVIPALKPCLLMSPLSVSQFLDPNTRFDLVIFDEASQVTVEDSVCALYRGRRHAIAGDSKQLPPTGFFRVTEDEAEPEDEEWESESNWESILDRAEGSGLRSMPLRWHYRSRDESLIAYSNRAFYGSKLITFPSTWGRHPDLGVQFRYVDDGLYDRGGSRTNRREAEVVKELVFEHLDKHPEKSLGVVTFNDAQRMAVQDAVDRHRYEHREFEDHFREDRLDGFFVKNLENVQGDERDCMIFSITYGPDSAGHFTMNFGPVSQPGGERRLNVAITRAREKVVVVSSVRAGDFPIGSELSGGGGHLRAYLDYAERGGIALVVDSEESKGDFESEFEVAVAEAIRQLGHEVVPQVGVSGFRVDLGVVHPDMPGRYVLGVECDGAAYHASATARDRDRLRQEVLENLGWRIERVWSPDWNANRRQSIKRLEAAIQAALAGSQAPAPDAAEPRDKPRPTVKVNSPLREEPAEAPHVPKDITQVAQWQISKALIAVASRGMGMERLALVQQTARELGFRRTGPRITDAIYIALARLLKDGRLQEQDGIMFVPVQTEPEPIVEVPDWDTVLEGQSLSDLGEDVTEARELRVAPPDGNGLLLLRSDMPLLELEIQLVKVIDGATANRSARDGSKLVAAQFAIKNRGRVVFEPYKTSARWLALDDQGTEHEVSTIHVSPSLHHVRIRPGAATAGFITFELPRRAKVDTISLKPSRESDTGLWPHVSRLMEVAPEAPEPAADGPSALSEDDPLPNGKSKDRRVDIMNASISGETVSLTLDAAHVQEATAVFDGANIWFKAGERYTSQKRGPRQTLYLRTSSVEEASRALRSARFNVNVGPLRK